MNGHGKCLPHTVFLDMKATMDVRLRTGLFPVGEGKKQKLNGKGENK